jgi:hypothetical protein
MLLAIKLMLGARRIQTHRKSKSTQPPKPTTILPSLLVSH